MSYTRENPTPGQSGNLQDRHSVLSKGWPELSRLPIGAESEIQIAKATAKKLKIPFIDPLLAQIEPSAVSLLKPDIAFMFQALPIRIVNDILLVVMANPGEEREIKALQLLTRCKIRPAAAPKSAISATLREVYKRSKEHALQKDQVPSITANVEAPIESEERALTISVISNKGGVGKTHLSINIAYALGKRGAKVLLIDADLGNADISTKLGIFPQYHLLDFLEKDQQIQDVVVKTEFSFDLICSTYGDFRLANLNYAQKTRFIKHFNDISQGYDFAVFDLGAGISRTVLDFALVADRTVIVTTPQDLISGYGCAKASFSRFKEIEERLEGKLPEHRPQWTFAPMVVINQARSLVQGIKLFDKLHKATNKNINANEGRFRIGPEYLGAIPYDRESVLMAEAKKRPLLLNSPYVKSSQCIQHMTKRFFDPDKSYDPRIEFRYPFRRFVAILSQKI